MLIALAGYGIDNHQVFDERRCRGDNVSLGIHGETGSIENDLIVTTHLIDHDRRHFMAAHDSAKHFRAQFPLAQMEGRGVYTDEHIRPGLHQLIDGVAPIKPVRPELLVVPGVFTDGERDVISAHFPDQLRIGGDEISHFIEHVISGKEDLGLPHRDLAAPNDRRRVGCLFPGLFARSTDIPGDERQRQIRRRGRELVDRRFRPLNETWLFDQVARRVAGYGQLGKDNQFGISRRRVTGETDHEPDIAGKVADGRIYLPESDPHLHLS
ncbi:MAG TPA: hypothetical protein VHX39_04510 [Acetobacteraceae bacterium]|nr:hypothetical protein [Acetobacteraceae bacterium]